MSSSLSLNEPSYSWNQITILSLAQNKLLQINRKFKPYTQVLRQLKSRTNPKCQSPQPQPQQQPVLNKVQQKQQQQQLHEYGSIPSNLQLNEENVRRSIGEINQEEDVVYGRGHVGNRSLKKMREERARKSREIREKYERRELFENRFWKQKRVKTYSNIYKFKKQRQQLLI